MTNSSFIGKFCSYNYFFIKFEKEKKHHGSRAPYISLSFLLFWIFFFSCCCCLKMYSVRRDPNHSYYYTQYWTMDCRQQQQQFLFHNRQIIKTRQQCFWSTKFSHPNKDQHYPLNKNSMKSNSQEISLPVYRAPCTFQNSLITTDKGRRETS